MGNVVGRGEREAGTAQRDETGLLDRDQALPGSSAAVSRMPVIRSGRMRTA